MIIYVAGCNSDIDCFWYIYSEDTKKRDRQDYMYYESYSIENAEDLAKFWNDMQDRYNFEDVENNFVEYFAQFVKFS